MMPQAANSRCASDLSPTPKSVLDCSSGKRSISPSKSPSVTARFKASWGRRLPALRRRALDIFVRRNESRTSNESDSEPKVIAVAVSMIFHSLGTDEFDCVLADCIFPSFRSIPTPKDCRESPLAYFFLHHESVARTYGLAKRCPVVLALSPLTFFVRLEFLVMLLPRLDDKQLEHAPVLLK